MSTAKFDWRTVAIVSAFVLQVFFFAPLQIFLNNTTEFSVKFSQLVLVLLVFSFALVTILYLLASKLSKQIFLAVVTFLSVAAFLESRIFFSLAEHRPFTGQLIDWTKFSALSAAELTAIGAVAILTAIFRRRRKVLYSVALFILFFYGLGFVYTTYSKFEAIQRSQRSAREVSPYFRDFYRLSEKGNVIQIVADDTQGALVHEILTSDLGRYSQVFDGFTLFSHAAGRYRRTYGSVCFYMTGRAPDPGTDVVASLPFTHEYIRTTLKEYSIVNTLAENGFKTFGFQANGLWCQGAYTACTVGRIFDGLPVKAARPANTAKVLLSLLDITLFQATPIALRRHIYDDAQWFLTRLVAKTRTHSGILDLFMENLTTDSRSGSYNYFHVAGGHEPAQFDENCNYVGTRKPNYENTKAQVACTLLQLERLIKKLKKLGIYDKTIIIVHGDHGNPWLPPSMPSQAGKLIAGHLMGTANPVMFVKPLNSRGPLRFSRAPVSIGDVPATINDAFGLDGQFPGVPMFSLSETAERERVYVWHGDQWDVFGEQAMPMATPYRIRGDLFSEHNWILPHPAHLEEAPSALPMDHENFPSFTQGFSVLEHHKGPVRWVEGTLARVYLSFPTDDKAQLVFHTYVPRWMHGQSVQVSINGKVIAQLGEKDLAGSLTHVIPLPDDIPRKKVNVIEFRMGKAFKREPDVRHLSVLFAYVGLEPLK